MFGLVMAIYEFPVLLIGSAVTIFALCGCCSCAELRARDLVCVKRLLLAFGHDKFEDFELMVFVHDTQGDEKALGKRVRVTAGARTVRTDRHSKGIFQQPLHLLVEQGTQAIVVDLLDNGGGVLATLKLNTLQEILREGALKPEAIHGMRQKHKGLHHPKIRLTMAVSNKHDEERGLAHDVDWIVQERLKRAEEQGAALLGRDFSELEVLGVACAGPLELFGSRGAVESVYVAFIGPPISRRSTLGIWSQKLMLEKRQAPEQEVDLVKVEGIQADPSRPDVFAISYFDEHRVAQKLMFRRVDRARDVWVDMLLRLVQKARDARKSRRAKAASREASRPIAAAPAGGEGLLLADRPLMASEGLQVSPSPRGWEGATALV